jgi:RNA polymerase sigma-70 factor (ECF subfamily)
MNPDDSFAQLMISLREGDQEAAAAIFERFVRRLVGVASGQFDSWLRFKVDVEGVVQSAFKSFFTGQGAGQFEGLADWDSLWGLLTVITLRKCYRRHEYLSAECRDPGREVVRPTVADGGESWWGAIDREPTPLEAAMLAETVDRLLDGLPSPEREIVELSLEGYSTTEIADRLGRSQRTVRRVRERVKDRLKSDQDLEIARINPSRLSG